MSILVAGMEMPKAEFGSMIVAIRPDGMVEDVMGCYVGKAVPVPPHGRLIDADVLAAKCDSPHWCVWLSEIDAAPTVIPASEEAE